MNMLSKELTNRIYRFRGYSLKSINELLYGELFFASPDELNDPYDARVSYLFKADTGKYNRLLEEVIKSLPLINAPVSLLNCAKYLSKTDLTYEELIEAISNGEFKILVHTSFAESENPEAIGLTEIFIRQLINGIHQRAGRNIYLTCFSKSYKEPIMWSHYADNHNGYCLIFKPYDNQILQNPVGKAYNRRDININEKFTGSHAIKYGIQPVKYTKKLKHLNGFSNFNAHIYGRGASKVNAKKIWSEYMKVPTIKHDKWKYEEELRIIDYTHWSPEYFNANGPMKRLIVERIFYYDRTQLSGICFGSKMSAGNKQEIIGIIRSMRESLFRESNQCLPIFLFYDAVQNRKEYAIHLKPTLGLDTNNIDFEISDYQKKSEEYLKYRSIAKRQNSKDVLVHSHYLD